MAARRCTQIKLLPLLLVTSTILGVVQGEKWHGAACHLPDYHGDGVTEEHQLPTGHFVCCVVKTCPKGTYPVICDTDNPSSTSCKECPAGTFRHHATESSDMYKCEPHNTCSQRGLYTKTPGTIISDAVCGCVLEQGYTEPIGVKNPTYCMGPKACPAGEELSLDHSCKLCKSGTFKRNSGFEQCRSWTQCERQGLKVFTYGSSTTDSVCQVMVSTEEASSANPVTTDPDTGSASRSTDWSMVIWIFVGLGVFAVVICCIVILIKRKCMQTAKFRNSCTPKSVNDTDQTSSTGTEMEERSPSPGPSTNLLQPNGPTQADPPPQTPADPLRGPPELNNQVNTEEDGLLCPPSSDLPEVDGPDSTSDEQSMDVEQEQNLVNDHTENERIPPSELTENERIPPSESPPMRNTELQQLQQRSQDLSGPLQANGSSVIYNVNIKASQVIFTPQSTSIGSANDCQIGNGNVANHASEKGASEHDATDTTVPSDNGVRVQYRVVSLSDSDSES